MGGTDVLLTKHTEILREFEESESTLVQGIAHCLLFILLLRRQAM
jgi:hypothetical protein